MSNNEEYKTVVDFNSRDISALPVFDMSNLQYLYLENNHIDELPEDMFIQAPNLKWLDARNNLIGKIPQSIENHSKIETLLLENNRLSFLPNYLGTATNLKCIHLRGNPLTYPTKNIVRSGTEYLMKYLIFEYENDRKIKNNFNCSDKRIDLTLKCVDSENNRSNKCVTINETYITINDHENKIVKKKVEQKTSSLDDLNKKLLKQIEVEKRSEKIKMFQILKSHSSTTCDKNDKYEVKSKKPIHNSNKYLKKLKARGREEQIVRIRESLMREAWLEKRRELLSRREKVLQDRKSLDALKHWRNNYRETKLSSPTFYALNLAQLPYGTDLEFVKILTRADIEKDLPDKYKKGIRPKGKSSGMARVRERPNIEMKISEMLEYMDTMRSDYVLDVSPREKKATSDDIRKLTDLRKKIVSLKIENDKSV